MLDRHARLAFAPVDVFIHVSPPPLFFLHFLYHYQIIVFIVLPLIPTFVLYLHRYILFVPLLYFVIFSRGYLTTAWNLEGKAAIFFVRD